MKNTWWLLVISMILALSLLSCQVLPNISLPGQTPSGITPPPLAETVSPPFAGEVANPVASVPDLIDLQGSLVALYERVNPGVVAIRVLTEQGGGLGSGFVIDKEGHIVTNFHVIEGFTDLEVDFPSGYKTRGEVAGTDTDSDLAVIKVDAPADVLHPLPLGDSSNLKVGQTVVAIGNPFGLSGTMTTGIISALGRTLSSLHNAPGGTPFTAGDIIQTDAAVNPGNSGGPLINLAGEVIGVNRAIRTESFSTSQEPVNSGISFAIAVNIVKRVVPSLIETGSYDYPYLGISSLDDISLLQQEALGLPRSTGVRNQSSSSIGQAVCTASRPLIHRDYHNSPW